MEYPPSKPPVAADKPPDDSTDSRRLKKRELDRKAQRLARERTKSRIAELEAMVEHLRHSDANTQILSLMDQLSQVTKERDKARQVLRSLDSTIHRHLNEGGPSESGSGALVTQSQSQSQPPRPSRSVIYPESHPGLPPHPPSLQIPPAPTDSAIWDDPMCGLAGIQPNAAVGCLSGLQANPAVGCGFDHHTNPIDDLSVLNLPPGSVSSGDGSYVDDVIVPRPAIECFCNSSDAGRQGSQEPVNKWRAANESLGRSTRLSRAEIMAEDLTSEDTPIRAVLEGWDSVEQEGRMTESWRKLQGVDQVCFKTCSQIERLAILRMMHILMTYHGDPTLERHASVPHWFLMRPSQAIAHSYAIDYFVWPGIRERFVFSQHQYCTNMFWDLFRGNFKIMWPYDFRDTYMHNSETGRYHLSPLFEERIRDISAWTMCPDFFVQFPELYGDIPTYLSVPASVSNMGSGGMVPYVQQAQREAYRRSRSRNTPPKEPMVEVTDL